MTIEELLAREGIRQTMAAYTAAGDQLRADELAAVFTDDGVVEAVGVPERDAFRYQGRSEIRSWITRWSERASDVSAPTHRATFVRHHLATSHITLEGADRARARTYWVAYTDIGPDHAGHYVDVFRRVGEAWLIAQRQVRLDWRSPQSLFTTAISRSR